MLTIHVKWSADATTRAVDILGSDSVGVVKATVARELKVPADAFTMFHDGAEMADAEVAVAKTGLVEGSLVEARPAVKYVARYELARIGLECSTQQCVRVVLANDAPISEKLKLVCLMIDCEAGVDAGEVLAVAAAAGRLEVVEMLVELFGPDKQDSRGMTALHHAAGSCNEQLPIVRLLLQQHADVNMQDSSGKTALHHARHLHTVQELLKHHADVTKQDLFGNTALHSASASGLADVVCELLKHKALVFCGNLSGKTALHTASASYSSGKVEVIQELLRHSTAGINRRNALGRTALYYAGTSEAPAAKVLIAHGADPTTLPSGEPEKRNVFADATGQGPCELCRKIGVRDCPLKRGSK